MFHSVISRGKFASEQWCHLAGHSVEVCIQTDDKIVGNPHFHIYVNFASVVVDSGYAYVYFVY